MITWGVWALDKELLVLRDKTGYEVDLEHMKTSAEMLDKIMQVANKETSYSAEDTGHLVRALNEIFDPQTTLCSSGLDRILTSTQVRELIRGF